jgi:hypothetical protein
MYFRPNVLDKKLCKFILASENNSTICNPNMNVKVI